MIYEVAKLYGMLARHVGIVEQEMKRIRSAFKEEERFEFCFALFVEGKIVFLVNMFIC